jgi:ABC-2 type transport system permease protein
VQLSEHVRTGRLDFFLLLPANPRFLLSLRVVDLGSFVNAASAVAVMVYALRQLGVTPSVLQAAGFLAACAAALLVHYSLMFIMACSSFWTVRAQGVVWGYYNLFNLARLPDTAFPRGFFRAVFTFALPMLLVANVPARLLAGTLQSPLPLLYLLGVSACCFAGSALLWRISVRRYTSASS